MGRESSHGIKELLTLVLKARHLSGSAFCWVDIGLPEQAVGWFPLGLRLAVEDVHVHVLAEHSCSHSEIPPETGYLIIFTSFFKL